MTFLVSNDTLWLDLETYSEIPINHGTYKYAENSEILLFAYAIGNEPAEVIDCTTVGGWRDQVRWLLSHSAEMVAHNAIFDRTVLTHHFGPRTVDVNKWICTMTQAYCHGLPGSLDKLCTVLNVSQEQRKIEDGRRLVLQFCKPRPKNQKLRRATRETHPEDWANFVEYARMDVEAMRACHNRMPIVNYPGFAL